MQNGSSSVQTPTKCHLDDQIKQHAPLSSSSPPSSPSPSPSPGHDSDSGHGPTSSSSASHCSSQAADKREPDDQYDFEDAQDTAFDSEAPFDECRNAAEASGAAAAPGGPIQDDDEHDADKQAPLEERLAETRQVLRLALSNEFNKAIACCAAKANRELYASLAHATLSFVRAALTLEQADLSASLLSIQRAFDVSNRKRRKASAASLMMRFLVRPNYDSYTDDEIHAELVHAESSLMLTLISFISDQSIICLVRGAFRIRACYQKYKECLFILEHRSKWHSAEARRHFESGVRMGNGIFNLLMSYLPRRVLRFLEYVGFSGKRSVAIHELDKSIELADGLRSVFSALVILTYHSYVENLFGLGSYDEHKVHQLNSTFLGHYPNSAFFLLFLGRYHQMCGQLGAAIDSFERCIAAQNDWKQFHAICHWEIMWCYAVQMNWSRAAHYSNLLRRESKWSPASYTYQYGTFLYAELVEQQRAGQLSNTSAEYKRRMANIRSIMQQVPDLRTRYAGKTIPAEKFAITRSMKFCHQNNRLTLPALEFLYIWNVFSTLRNSPRQVERLLERVDSELNHIRASGATRPPDAPPDGCADELALVLLLRGMCLKHLKRSAEAERNFLQVIDDEHKIVDDTFLVPHMAMELAVLNLDRRNYDQARHWVKTARQNYTGYLLETIVHFRLHAASRLIRIASEQQQHETTAPPANTDSESTTTGSSLKGDQPSELGSLGAK